MPEHIYANGAYIVPRKLANGKWAWVVAAFDETVGAYADGDDITVPVAHIGEDEYHAHATKFAEEMGIEDAPHLLAALKTVKRCIDRDDIPERYSGKGINVHLSFKQIDLIRT